ncbi:NAD(P)H-quinone oxidoreductase subunit I, chloroplastic [Sporomusa silvacetica DSM 10669]|uniref:NAD(P)H-quinone oxidoreductase subunit I, chloroplastic n=1 Tax=Sporomusa silvacetica DSM 10669 TaxID=1123289 RepID=A0ABZ3IHA6_9FIRM|nr:NAD(P)H-quinone oxidoreductase subunit I, chloroplastic [Sporomusa silvacetica DSM 10669]
MNTRYKKMACQRCRQVCPAGCISDAFEFDLSHCIECGLCLSSCPAEAIAGDGYSGKVLEAMLTADDSLLCLSCSLQDKQSSWPCLGFLDARLLLALVYSGKNSNRRVVVNNCSCSGCKRKVADYLGKILISVNQILSLAGKYQIVHGNAVSNFKPKEKVVSRRGFIRCLVGEAISVFSAVVIADSIPKPLPRQEFFIKYTEALAVSGMRPTGIFSGIAIGEKCRACGLCARICPQQAIAVEDNGGVVDFYHNAFKCTGCGVCLTNCPWGAIALGSAYSLTLFRVATCSLPRCLECGKLYQPVGDHELCLECFLKDSSIACWSEK